ncbi:MAG: alanine racemase [Pseudomonadota bacterium]|nr:alanine racemase [Pseudomonadota bacterium]
MSNTEILKKEIIETFGTPCPVIDLDIVEKNIARSQSLCEREGKANRPHIKTHKSPRLAKMQMMAGAIGVTCQKLGEAEVMFEAGIKDILIATNILGAAKSGRLAALQKKVALKVSADNKVSLESYAYAANYAGRAIDVLIECDTGQKRSGVETVEEAIELAKVIKDEPMLNFTGLLFYPTKRSWADTQSFCSSLIPALKEIELTPQIISTGGTPNLANIGKLRESTEHRAGTCIFNDRMMIDDGFASLEDCALKIYSSVVSRAGINRGILDAGSKTLTSDTGNLVGFGLIMEHPDAEIVKLAEEHGFLNLESCQKKPDVGTVVRVIPNHACVCVNMMNEIVAVRDHKIVEVIKVEARGLLV